MRFVRAVLVLALVLAPLPAFSTPTNFDFKDVELGCIFQTIAILGRFNVVVDPMIARGKMTIALRDMEPLDALHTVAEVQELAARRLESKIELGGAMPETYMIARRDKAGAHESRSVLLRYASPAEIARALAPETDAKVAPVRIATDERSNRVVLSGQVAGIERLEKLIRELDRPADQMKLQMFLVAGQPGKPEPVWQGGSMLVNGQATRFEVTGGGKPTSTGWRVTKLAGHAQMRVNPEGFATVTMLLEVSADDRGTPGQFKLNVQQQLNAGEEAEAGALEITPGQTLTLRVKATRVAVTPPPPPVPPEVERPTVPTTRRDAGEVIDLDVPAPSPSPSAQTDGLDLEGI